MNFIVLVKFDTRGPHDPPFCIYDELFPEGFDLDGATFKHFWDNTKKKYAIPGATVTLLQPIRKCIPSTHSDVDPDVL